MVSKPGRHRAVGACENLVVFDVQRAQPALLAHGDGDEVADLDQFGLAEMLMQARPQLVAGRQVPGDRLGVGQRRFLPLVVTRRALEIDQVGVVVLLEAGLGRLDRALVAAELAQHRTRDVDAAQLLDLVVGDAVLEHVAPGVGERPERRRHMRANRLAFRPRRSLPRAAFEFGDHGRIRDRRWIDIANAWFRHRRLPPRNDYYARPAGAAAALGRHVAATAAVRATPVAVLGNHALARDDLRASRSEPQRGHGPRICARFAAAAAIVTLNRWLLARASIPASIVNFVQGYSKVYRRSDTGRKQYVIQRLFSIGTIATVDFSN